MKEGKFMSEAVENTEKNVTRRGAIAGIGALIAGGLVAPKQAHADSKTPTRKDVGKVSFEIAAHKEAADKYERQSNKQSAVTEDSTDDTYPSAKAVYDYIKVKESYQHELTDVGKSLFVGEDGNTFLKDYTVDTELKEDSSNPVQGKVLFKAIDDLEKAVGLDDKPTKHEKTGDELTDSIKYVCKSNGYFVTYQEAQAAPEDFTTFEQGVNYSYTGKGKITGNEQNWAVKRVDDAFTAVCKDEFGAIYSSNKKETATWTAPLALWHS